MCYKEKPVVWPAFSELHALDASSKGAPKWSEWMTIVSQLFGGDSLFENNYDLWVFKFILIHPTVTVTIIIIIFISVAIIIIT